MKRILLFCAIALTTLTFAQNVPSYVPTNGLVGWWPFNGNANDESGNGNNGTVSGATLTSDRNGFSNSAYNFDGIDDKVLLGKILSNQKTEFTINLWASTTSNYGALIAKKPSGAWLEGRWGLAASSTEIGFCYPNFYSPSGQGCKQLTRSKYNWVMITLSLTTNSVNLYENGELLYTDNGSLVTQEDVDVIVGDREDINNSPFEGQIDDIGIWNRALTQQEIIDLYSSCNSINASINLSNPSTIGSNLTLSAVATGNNLNYQWETNPCKNGWQTVSSNSTYSGVSTSDLTVSNVELSNHQQPFRVIVSDNNCSDTSDVVYVEITDTCINTVIQSVAVTDTLIIDISLAGLSAPNNINTMKVYPNPSNDIVNIDNGDYALMNGYSIKIINALGQEKFNNAINIPAFQIPVSQLGDVGVYYISIYDNQQQLVESKVLVLE